jgi:small subunit ribosomal protein S16
MGRKKKPHYRVVVADRSKPRDGGFVESLGYYQPLSDPARVVLDLERVDYWLEQGATPSDTVRTLVAKARKGGDDSFVVGEVNQEEAKAQAAEDLAARRKAEQEEAAAKAEAEKAAAEAKKAAQAKKAAEAEAEAKKAADDAEEPAAEAEKGADSEGDGEEKAGG